MATTKADLPTPIHPLVNHEATSASEPLHHYQQPPIHHLPPEVLCAVFLPLAVCYRDLFRARMVCKYWVEVIDSTPELWTSVSNGLHSELQAMIIRNSGNQLLEVDYNECYWLGDSKREHKIAKYAWLMKPTASRWHTLTYHQWQGEIWPLSLPLHNLQRIDMKVLAPNSQRSTLDAPKLLYVNINHVALDLSSLSRLQFLILQAVDCNLDELTAVLRTSPGLKELSLKQMSPRIGTRGLPSSYMSKIHLPQLRNLHISGVLAESSSFLLDRIKAPSLEIFNAFVDDPSDVAAHTQLCEAAGRHLGTFPLPKSQKANFKIATWRFTIDCGIGERIFTIVNRSWDGANGRQAILASIASMTERIDSRTREEITSLEISCHYDDECGECLRIVHLLFPRIDQIFVEDRKTRETQVLSVIQHLSLPSQLGLTAEWLFPKLAKLDLCLRGSTSTDIGNRMVELAERRKEIGQAVEITELRIQVGFGKIDPSAVEILSQSVTQFELVPVGGPA
ncbi:hypothetical protein FS837_002735, partial [Tulasnella sp. UAMH 9824]